MSEELYVVLRRKYGTEAWGLIPLLFPSEGLALDDAKERYVKNRTFNNGRGYEYKVCPLNQGEAVISGGGKVLTFEDVASVG